MVEEMGGAVTAPVATSDAVGSALLRCYTEALRLNSAVDRLGRLEEENGMIPSAGNFGNIVTMFVRAKRLDSARQAKAMMEASGEFSLFTVTFRANTANDLTRSPLYM